MSKQLLTLQEVAKRVELSVGRIYNLRHKYPKDFPPPVGRHGCMPLFARDDVDFWNKTRPDRRKRKRRGIRK